MCYNEFARFIKLIWTVMTSQLPTLKLSLFGSFRAALGERPLTTFGSNKAQALLIYLLLEGQKQHAREALMTMLWPDATLKSAQGNLRQTISRLRKAIPESGGHPLLVSERTTVSLNPEAKYEVDVLTFTDLLSGQSTIDQMEEAAVLYRGDFLADFYLPDSNEFEEWAANKRAHHQRQAQTLFQTITVHHLEQRAFVAAETAVRRQLSLDNLDEAAHRQLIEILARDGRRQAALAHYKTFRKQLQAELGLAPRTRNRSVNC